MKYPRTFTTLVWGTLALAVPKIDAIGCEVLPRQNGVYIDTIRATSDLTRLAATVNLYNENGEVAATKEASIHLDTGTVVEGWDAPQEIEIYPPGLGAPHDFTKYEYNLKLDSGAQEFVGNVVNKESGETVSFELPDLKSHENGQEVVLWFVSEQLQRTYVFYEYFFALEETVRKFQGGPPQVVVVIAPIPGGTGDVLYLAYENFLESISFGDESFDGRMTAFESLRLAVVPQNTCTATTVFYREGGVELRNLGPGPFEVGGIAISSEPSADYVYKADHVMLLGRPNEYVIYKTNIWTGDRKESPLNADQVLGLFGQSSAAAPEGASSPAKGSSAPHPSASSLPIYLSFMTTVLYYMYAVL